MGTWIGFEGFPTIMHKILNELRSYYQEISEAYQALQAESTQEDIFLNPTATSPSITRLFRLFPFPTTNPLLDPKKDRNLSKLDKRRETMAHDHTQGKSSLRHSHKKTPTRDGTIDKAQALKQKLIQLKMNINEFDRTEGSLLYRLQKELTDHVSYLYKIHGHHLCLSHKENVLKFCEVHTKLLHLSIKIHEQLSSSKTQTTMQRDSHSSIDDLSLEQLDQFLIETHQTSMKFARLSWHPLHCDREGTLERLMALKVTDTPDEVIYLVKRQKSLLTTLAVPDKPDKAVPSGSAKKTKLIAKKNKTALELSLIKLYLHYQKDIELAIRVLEKLPHEATYVCAASTDLDRIFIECEIDYYKQEKSSSKHTSQIIKLLSRKQEGSLDKTTSYITKLLENSKATHDEIKSGSFSKLQSYLKRIKPLKELLDKEDKFFARILRALQKHLRDTTDLLDTIETLELQAAQRMLAESQPKLDSRHSVFERRIKEEHRQMLKTLNTLNPQFKIELYMEFYVGVDLLRAPPTFSITTEEALTLLKKLKELKERIVEVKIKYRTKDDEPARKQSRESSKGGGKLLMYFY